MKILTVFGTRPEAIKMAPLVKELNKINGFDCRVCVTGQHREMLDQVLDLFKIAPNYDLDIMKPGQSLYDITTLVLNGVGQIINRWRPDLVLVHGDTTTAMASSLAAFYEKVRVGHVEAGLRTWDIYSPWPEEINRSIIGKIAHFHFSPTVDAKANLLKENVVKTNIFVTGNTVIDSLLEISKTIDEDKVLLEQLSLRFKYIDQSKKLILITGHRRENIGDGFDAIFKSMASIAERDDVQIIYPVHLNPKVKKPANDILGLKKNVYLIDPQEYVAFVYLLKRSHIVVTDSGGIQEEAPSLNKPVLVTRNTTERPEAIKSGAVMLVGTDQMALTKAVNRLLDNPIEYFQMQNKKNPYGSGEASKNIASIIKKNEFIEI